MISGWDDAKLCRIAILGEPQKTITMIYPYYCNPNFLRTQLDGWARLPDVLRSHIIAIIVDDGSPKGKAADVLRLVKPLPFRIRLFEIEVDVRWNWLAARNIAMSNAIDGWCLGTDIDHVVPEETLRNLVFGIHNSEYIYRFQRRENGEFIHPHPNSWFMTRKMFWKFGGYDESLSGFYGTDGEARRRWAKTAPVYTLPDYLQRYEHVGDSSTVGYGRKEMIDAKVQRIIKARTQYWKPKVLSFPYHEVIL